MFPNNDDLIIDITCFKELEAVVDVIYNPLKTALLRNAEKHNIKAVGGLYMLVGQAVYASSIFIDKNYDQSVITNTYDKIYNDKKNIVLIGMPSCGKSTIGQEISRILNKEYIDTDLLIEKKLGMSISDFLNKDNEEEFRKIETSIINGISKKNNLVISTGGGIIKKEENVFYLKANGTIIFIDRPLELLEATSSRPLSSNKKDLENLYNVRYPLYKKYADIIVKNDIQLNDVIEKILKEI